MTHCCALYERVPAPLSGWFIPAFHVAVTEWQAIAIFTLLQLFQPVYLFVTCDGATRKMYTFSAEVV